MKFENLSSTPLSELSLDEDQDAHCYLYLVHELIVSHSRLDDILRGFRPRGECLHRCKWTLLLNHLKLTLQIRKNYRRFMKDTFNLTPRERKLLSLPKPPKDEALKNLDKDLEEMRKRAGIIPSAATTSPRDDRVI